MMLAQLLEAAGTCPRGAIDAVSSLLWKAFGAGEIEETDAQRVAEMLQARRGPLTAARERRPPRPKKPRPCRSPDRRASLERRRRLASAGPLPPVMAVHYTTGQLAVLAVVAGEVAKRGSCMLPIGRLAAVAGVSQTLVRNALRLAAELGHLSVTERRFRFARSLPNVVAIVAAEWRSWLARGRVHFREPHEQKKSLSPVGKGFRAGGQAGREAREGGRRTAEPWLARARDGRKGVGGEEERSGAIDGRKRDPFPGRP